MPKRRFNIWLDIDFIDRVAKAAKTVGVKTSTFMRMAILEKLRKHQDGHPNEQDPK